MRGIRFDGVPEPQPAPEPPYAVPVDWEAVLPFYISDLRLASSPRFQAWFEACVVAKGWAHRHDAWPGYVWEAAPIGLLLPPEVLDEVMVQWGARHG